MRILRLLYVTLSVLNVLPAAAQEQLPGQLAGVARLSQSRVLIVVNWTLAIESQTADGGFRGRLTYDGQFCQLRDAPIAGTYQGGELEFAAEKPALGCDRLSMKLKEFRAGSHEFEGTANAIGKGQNPQGFNYTLTVYAKPR
jgi:hypothetical protein